MFIIPQYAISAKIYVIADHRGFFISLDYGKLVEKFWGLVLFYCLDKLAMVFRDI